MSALPVDSAAKTLWVLGQRVTLIPTVGNYALAEVVAPPNTPGPPPHHHVDCTELFYPVEGILEVLHDGEWVPLKPGEALQVPPGSVHSFRNPGDSDVRFITAFDPAGFQQFFLELGIDAATPRASALSISPEAIKAVTERASTWGMIIAAP